MSWMVEYDEGELVSATDDEQQHIDVENFTPPPTTRPPSSSPLPSTSTREVEEEAENAYLEFVVSQFGQRLIAEVQEKALADSRKEQEEEEDEDGEESEVVHDDDNEDDCKSESEEEYFDNKWILQRASKKNKQPPKELATKAKGDKTFMKKRGRGRPKKEKVNTDSENENENENEKEDDVESEVVDDEDDKDYDGESGGRDSSDEEYLPQVGSEKRKRRQITTEKRGRGRPKKVNTDSQSDDNDEEEATVVKKKPKEDALLSSATEFKSRTPATEEDKRRLKTEFEKRLGVTSSNAFFPILKTLADAKEYVTGINQYTEATKNLCEELGTSVVAEKLKEVRGKEPIKLSTILESEILHTLLDSANKDMKVDWRDFTKKFGQSLKTNPRFKNLHQMRNLERGHPDRIDKNNPLVALCDELQDAASFRKALAEAQKNTHATLVKLRTLGIGLSQFIANLITSTAKFREGKYAIAEKCKRIHADITEKYDSRLDELSSTGARAVKQLLDYPYFKTSNDLSRLDTAKIMMKINNEDEEVMLSSPIDFKRQKWTLNDLETLKVVLKDVAFKALMRNVNARYLELVEQSDNLRIGELIDEGVEPDARAYRPEVKRRRGRPSRVEAMQRDNYGILKLGYKMRSPQFENYGTKFELRPSMLGWWRVWIEKKYKDMNFDSLLVEQNIGDRIPWSSVAEKVSQQSKKLRLPQDCKLAYKHWVDPKISHNRITIATCKQIDNLRRKDKSWTEIADGLNRQNSNASGNAPQKAHTEFQYFQRYQQHQLTLKENKVQWDEEMDKTILNQTIENPANWRKIAASVNNESVSKKDAIERFKKINPVLKNGPFSRVEDCLLIVSMEHLKDFILADGTFGSLQACLPWRYENTWRERAGNLFSDWIVPWTIEEDKLLLQLAESYKRNWQKIAEEFNSFKNRKGCLTRYKILTKALDLKTGKFKSLEKYHEAYAMTRYNVFQYKHLEEILAKLKAVDAERDDSLSMQLLRDDSPPTEEELERLLYQHDPDLVNNAITGLERYISQRQAYWAKSVEGHGDKKKTFDRRTFHPKNPISVASTIHLRGLALKPKESIKNLNDFEDAVYTYYARFCQTKTPNFSSPRLHLPPASFFHDWDATTRIMAPMSKRMMQTVKNQPCSQKWAKFLNGSGADATSSEDEDEEVEEEPKKRPTHPNPTTIKKKRQAFKKKPIVTEKRTRSVQKNATLDYVKLATQIKVAHKKKFAPTVTKGQPIVLYKTMERPEEEDGVN